MVQVNYYTNFKNLYLSFFYIAIISIGILSITPHKEVVRTISEQSNSLFWNLANEHNVISKIAYIGENIFGQISDKIRHILAFIVLSVLFDFSYIKMARKIKSTLLILYGIALEAIQLIIPYREFSINDIVFNTLSILCYFQIITKFFIIKQKG